MKEKKEAKLKIEYVKTDSIRPYAGNAKEHPDWQIEQIMLSMQEFGNLDPIGIWGDEIVEGHGRLIAAKELGFETVPVIRLDQLTDEKRRAYAIVHNKLTMNTDFDLEKLQAELDAIDTDMSAYGFEELEKELENLGSITEDDYEDELDPEEPKAKKGDIYQLGEHRLMCGDTTSVEDVERLMNGEKADLIVTDPPYGVSYAAKNEFLNAISRGNRIQKEIAGDHQSEGDMSELWEAAFRQMFDFSKDKMAYYISGPQGGDLLLLLLLLCITKAGFLLKHTLVWVKNNHVLGRADYNYKHEPIAYGWKPKGTHEFFGGFDVSVFEEQIDIDRMKESELRDMLRRLLEEAEKCSDVIHEDKPLKNDLHPTMKPVRLLTRLITNSSKPGDIVMDLFGGSGSTLIACEQMGRKCFMMEIDPHYVDVIIDRWEKLTGKKAVKLK